ncbi:MAG: alpha/beta hydrolase [Desulfuromusa sp.]|nr:alpha/beta hydrolase [Desulfuromusa sp.]
MPIVASILKIVLVIIIMFAAMLYFRQDGMIFLGAKLSSNSLKEFIKHFPRSEIRITAADGTELHGWYLQANGDGPTPLLIYFGGNAENIAHMLLEQNHFKGYSLLLMSYRGYGLSGGKPSQKALCGDALFLYDHFSSKPEIDASRILLMGRSLGSGVAVHLASNRIVERVILVSPFDSMMALAKEFYPWVPVSLLLKHPFDSLSLAPSIKVPLLTIIGSRDSIIAPQRSKVLVQAWGGKTQLVEIEGVDHNELGNQRQFWDVIEDFIDDSTGT